MRLLRDLAWWWRARGVQHLDGSRQGGPGGGVLEVVVPRWWDARRWAAWLRCPESIESIRATARGLRFLRVRARPVAVVDGGKVARADRLLRIQAIAASDPGLRSVPDEELERFGVLVRDEDGDQWR